MSSKADLVLSVDLGGTKAAFGLVSSEGKILHEMREKLHFAEGRDAVMQQIVDGIDRLRKIAPDVDRLGVASAGPLDVGNGVLLNPTNFVSADGERWGNFPLQSELSRRTGMNVRVENDAAAALLAEKWQGSGSEFEDVMILTLGTGLGVAFLVNGQLFRSGGGLHPEAGHMMIRPDEEFAICGCGNTGCAEALVSGSGFARWANLKFGEDRSAEAWADYARGGELSGEKAFELYAENLALTLRNFAILFRPERVILTGGFAETADLFLAPARERLKELIAVRDTELDLVPEICLSELENQAGILGGAALYFSRL